MFEKAVENILKESPGQHTTTCGLIYEDGSHWISSNHACHAGLRTGARGGKLKLAAVFTKWMNPHTDLSKKDAASYAKWLTNDSPYSEVFMEKDPGKIVGGCYLSYPDKPANLLLAGNIATRFIHEGYGNGFSSTWARLVNLGADPTYAYMFALNFKSVDKKIMVMHGADSHNGVCFTTYKLQKAKNFLHRKCQKLTQPYNTTYTYNSIDDLWGQGVAYGDDHNSLMEFCSSLKVNKIQKHMSYNIFEKKFDPKGKGPIITNDEDLLNVFEQFKKELAA